MTTGKIGENFLLAKFLSYTVYMSCTQKEYNWDHQNIEFKPFSVVSVKPHWIWIDVNIIKIHYNST